MSAPSTDSKNLRVGRPAQKLGKGKTELRSILQNKDEGEKSNDRFLDVRNSGTDFQGIDGIRIRVGN